jgi:hypothetical protein
MTAAHLGEYYDAVQRTIERRSCTSYKPGGLTGAHYHEHSFDGGRELMIQDVPLSIDNDAVTIRFAIKEFSASNLLISISAHSVMILSLREDAGNDCEDINRGLIRVISLPVAVDYAQATCELDNRSLALKLPLVATVPTISNSAGI